MRHALDDEAVVAASQAWAASGAQALTGPPEGAGLGPPSDLVPRLHRVAEVLRDRSHRLGSEIVLDPLELLTERAAIAGLSRQGQTSCGGATRLLRTEDGWLAVTLAREDDVDLVPAWLRTSAPEGEPWGHLARTVVTRPTAQLVDDARLLGLPVGALPASRPTPPLAPPPRAALPYLASWTAPCEPTSCLEGTIVADLSSLWAGPLCGSLLADAGATVIKVESTSRPDGARFGPAALFDLLNAGKQALAIDLAADEGRRTLRELLRRVDVVIEGSRPRALEQMGVKAAALLSHHRPRAWVSITGHGRSHADRVGFGDDAAVAGGLVAWSGSVPYFCADAIADPASGLVAAAAVLDALSIGGCWLLDVSLAGVAAHLAGATLDAQPASSAPEIGRPRRVGAGPELGAHTAEVLDALGVVR